MARIVYPICCGVDVHKEFFIATIIKTNGLLEPKYLQKRFSTFNNSILSFKKWLIENGCFDVCMESTGKYWVPVYNLLEDSIRVVVASPKWVAAVKGNKDDKKDAKWIGELFRLGLVRSSFIPEHPIRILREYTRYRSKLVSCRSSEKNRFQNSFTVCNVALDSVVSDMFGVSASAITDYLINNDVFDSEHVKSLLKRGLKIKSDLVVESIQGHYIHPAQKIRMKLVRNHLEYVDKEIDKLDSVLDALIKPYEQFLSLLCTIPGVDRKSAITIISEIGVDMGQFGNSKRLCSWAGLSPGNNRSAGKNKSVRITRAGVYLKPALVQVAHAAVKSKDVPYYKHKYDRIYKRRGKKRAIIAIARMILTAIFNILVSNEAWNPSDLFKVDMPIEIRERHKQKAINAAIKLLVSQGLIQSSELLRTG